MTRDADDSPPGGKPTPVHLAWNELVGPCILGAAVETRLHLTRSSVATMASQRQLLRVITADGTAVFPCWQFEVPDLPEILGLFPEDDVDGLTLVGWLRTPEPDLGETPIDALARGERGRVLAVAQKAARSLGG